MGGLLLGAAASLAQGPVEEDFLAADIGNPALAGQSVAVSGGVDITAGGKGISGNSDQFHFRYREVMGDFDYRVRVRSLELGDLWSRAGLMAREGLEPTSRFAAALTTPSLAGSSFLHRTASALALAQGTFPANHPYTWLRLKRAGALVEGYASVDGRSWQPLGNALLKDGPVLFGLAVCSAQTNQVVTAQLRDMGEAEAGSSAPLPARAEPLGPSTRRSNLVISEIMYHPASAPQEDMEFVEIFNSQPYYDDVSGYRISGDIDYTIPQGTIIPGGGFLVVAAKPEMIKAAYGITNVVGGFSATLPDKSGTVRLRNNQGAIYQEVNYRHHAPWPIAAAGAGFSMVLAYPSYGEGNPAAWAASDLKGGTPGRLNALRTSPLHQVVINEFLARTDGAQEDFIELYNRGTVELDLGGCGLSDDPDQVKFTIPAGVKIQSGACLVFKETQLGFSLSASGDVIFLTSPNQEMVLDAWRFEGQRLGISMGRYPNGGTEIHPLTSPTPGAPNRAILVCEVVINEIMYNPISRQEEDEYIELYNRGSEPVDLGGWRLVDGVDFTFPAGANLPAGGYLVVARDAARLRGRYSQLNARNTIGNFSGALSGRGERVALARPYPITKKQSAGQSQTETLYAVVDEVTYQTGGSWGEWADGGGSSLELRDPAANHRLGPNWADSDESSKATWTTIENTDMLALGRAFAPDNLQIILMGEGECVIDEIEVIGEGETNRVRNGNFESGMINWTTSGNHRLSSLAAGAGVDGSAGLHLRAMDQGDTGANKVWARINPPLVSGQTATLRAKVRWLRGCPEILLRLHGNYLEAAGRMQLPESLGTPGAPNSQAVAQAAPAIDEVSHFPVLPGVQEPIRITARVDDARGVSHVQVHYRVDPSTTWEALPMSDEGVGGDWVAGDGIYTAYLPAQETPNLLAFYIEARGPSSQTGAARFPLQAPAQEALVRVGEKPVVSSFGTYRFWVTKAVSDQWTRASDLSNELHDGTFIYGDHRVVYNARARYTGSPYHQQFTTPTGAPCHYSITLPKDHLVLGTASFNKIHWPGNGPGDDDTLQREQTAYWMVRQLGLPWNHQRYIHFFVNGVKRGKLLEDTQVPSAEGVRERFPDDPDGYLHKLNPWFEFNDPGTEQFANASWATLLNYTVGGKKRLARYRWNWAPRAVKYSSHDYDHVFALVDAANAPAEIDLIRNLEAHADMEQWLRTFAIEHAVGNWDSFGNRNAQNMFAYKPLRGRWHMMVWDFNIVLGGSGGFSDGPSGDNLFQTSDEVIARIYETPHFRRIYLRALQEIADGPMNTNEVYRLMEARHAAFIANGLTVAAPGPIRTWINTRRNYLFSQLPNTQSPFVLATPAELTLTNGNLATLSGTGPLTMHSIRVNGRIYPVQWSSVTNWTAQIPVSEPQATWTVQCLDEQGQVLAASDKTVLVRASAPAPRPEDYLVISEIMYRPGKPLAAFVEIHNTSAQTAFDISGYRLEGLDFVFPPGTVISPQGFAVATQDKIAHLAAYGNLTGVAGTFSGKLDLDGEMLMLVQPGAVPGTDRLISQLRYGNLAPWPLVPADAIASLQWLGPGYDQTRPGHWAVVLPPPPQEPEWQFASVTGPASTNRLLLYLSDLESNLQGIAGRWPGMISFPSQPLGIAAVFRPTADGQYTGYLEVDGQTSYAFGRVKYNTTNGAISFDLGGNSGVYFSGKVSADETSLSGTFSQSTPQGSQSAPFSVTRFIPGGDVFVDDLFLARGERPEAGSNLIRNGNFETGQLEFWTVSTNHARSELSTEIKHAGAASLHLKASQGGLAEKTAVWQETLDLEPGQVYTLSFWYRQGEQGTALTARLLEGGPARTVSLAKETPPTVEYTPGRANTVTNPPPPLPLVWLNEVQVSPAGPRDNHNDSEPWIELYNSGSSPIDLSGFGLSPDPERLDQWVFPAGSILQAGERRLVWVDGESSESTAQDWHTSFRLADGPGTILLSRVWQGVTQIVDGLRWEALLPGNSYGASPDGQALARYVFTQPTPRTSNSAAQARLKIFINEWMAVNDGSVLDSAQQPPEDKEDWFELYNPNPVALDLSGFTLTDDPANPNKWRIPAGTLIPAQGYLLVWADEDQSQNVPGLALHTNFKLSQNGEQIQLSAPDGALVDEVVFGPQTVNVSQGRIPDGSETAFQNLILPTPGQSNQAVPSTPIAVQIARLAGSAQQCRITWASQPGGQYQVQYKESLTDSAWSNLGPWVTATGAATALVDPLQAGRNLRFYRVLQVK